MHNYGEAGYCILPVHIGGEGREAFSAGKAGVGFGEFGNDGGTHDDFNKFNCIQIERLHTS